MRCRVWRREFLQGMGAAAAATAVTSFPAEALWRAQPLYPPMDLSYFDTAITPAPADILFGYAGAETTARRSKTLHHWASAEFNCAPMSSRNLAAPRNCGTCSKGTN